MKSYLQRILLAVIFLTVVTIAANAQTYISGIISANATWTVVNSPYIITDTTVVIPGITLTIQPGVVVKFADAALLEIRQANIYAQGTSVDSIYFTSNSATPHPGIWSSIYLNQSIAGEFNFCSFKYAHVAITDQGFGTIDSLKIKNSFFNQNNGGVGAVKAYIDSCSFINNTGCGSGSGGYIKNSTFSYNESGISGYDMLLIKNCTINYNQTGIYDGTLTVVKNCNILSNTVEGILLGNGSDTVIGNYIAYNGNGITDYIGVNVITQNIIELNTVGIMINTGCDTAYCNKICNNTSYDIYFNQTHNNGYYLLHNDWCTNDSATIESHIYDGYDNLNLAFVNFIPFDTAQCYLSGCNLQVTATTTLATCGSCPNGTATAHVANGTAPYTFTWYTTPLQNTQTATGLAPGTYTVCVSDAHGCASCNDNIIIDSINCSGFSVSTQVTNASCSSCNDGSAWATPVGGAAPYNYIWYTSPIQYIQTAYNLLPGLYYVCVTDQHGCQLCDSALISIGNCSANFNLYADTNSLHQYYAVNLAAGVAPLSFLWQWGDGPSDTAAYPTHTYAVAGHYSICLDVTDATGCTNHFCNSYYLQKSTEAMVYVNVIHQYEVGTQEYSGNNNLDIYPNPANNTLNVIGITGNAKAEIYDISSKLLLTKTLNTKQIDISALAKGLYFIKLTHAEGSVVRKFVKE